MRLDFEVFGERQVSRDLLRLGNRAGNARPAFDAIADRLEGISAQQFDSQGGRSRAWAPLADSTRRRKAALGLDHRILHATGELRRSLTGGPGGQRITTLNQIVYGTTVPYAGFHQAGGGHLPRRRVVDLTECDRKEMVQILQRYMLTGVIR